MRNLCTQITSRWLASRQRLSPRRVVVILLSSSLLLAVVASGKLPGLARQTFQLAQTQPQLLSTNTIASVAPTVTPAAVGQIQILPGSNPPLPSGYIPAVCNPYKNSDLLVDCWLAQHPTIANSIVWRFGGSSGTRAYPQWKKEAKEDLVAEFGAARNWFQNGMTNFRGRLVPDPPPNLYDPQLIAGSNVGHVIHTEADAWSIYLGHVGLSLAAEINGVVPWSLRNYNALQLAQLFNANESTDDTGRDRIMFQRTDYSNDLPLGYEGDGGITPSNATYTFKFLKDNDLIGPTQKETIVRLLQWAKRLSHYQGGSEGMTTWQNNYDHWQYYGGQTVSRTIEGTVLTRGSWQDAARHWTGGCGGTSAFLPWVLRAVNIPASRTYISPSFHYTIWFSSENLFLSHGDDPYSARLDENPPELLVNAQTFNSWFRTASPQAAADNVGRRTAELSVKYPGMNIVKDFCKDVQAKSTHATGKVYNHWFKKPYFTLSQLEQAGLWDRLAKKAILTGTCQP